ncbi:MAG: DUF3857 domain-containing protein, partial [Psychroserpens sp.]|nr:DUF3857 domain-containing protein [Psychroserpens sp.]
MVILSQASKSIAFIGLFLFSLAILAQEQTPNDYEYQTYKEKLPKSSFVQLELINEDLFDIDPNGPQISNHYYQRILCLDKNAINLKKRNVGYNSFFSITNISATLYYPEKGKYKKEKVKEFEDKAVITDDIHFYDDYREKQFYFENIREGSVIDLVIDRKVNDYHLLPNRSFSSPLHSKKELYRAKVHKDIEIGFFEFNMDKVDVNKTEKKEGDYIIYEWTMIDSEKEVFSG